MFRKVARRNEVDLSTVCGTVLKASRWLAHCDGFRRADAASPEKDRSAARRKALSDALIAEAAALAATEVSPIDDVRADRQYRLDIVSYLVRDGLSKLRLRRKPAWIIV